MKDSFYLFPILDTSEIFTGTRRHCPSPHIVDRTAEWSCAGWTTHDTFNPARYEGIARENNQERLADHYHSDNSDFYVLWYRKATGEPSFTVNENPHAETQS
jgi:hypothetical protein